MTIWAFVGFFMHSAFIVTVEGNSHNPNTDVEFTGYPSINTGYPTLQHNPFNVISSKFGGPLFRLSRKILQHRTDLL